MYFEPQDIRDTEEAEVDPGRFGIEPSGGRGKPWATQAELWGAAPYQIAAYAKIGAEMRKADDLRADKRREIRETLEQDRDFTGGE
jgi:hypothetical protein